MFCKLQRCFYFIHTSVIFITNCSHLEPHSVLKFKISACTFYKVIQLNQSCCEVPKSERWTLTESFHWYHIVFQTLILCLSLYNAFISKTLSNLMCALCNRLKKKNNSLFVSVLFIVPGCRSRPTWTTMAWCMWPVSATCCSTRPSHHPASAWEPWWPSAPSRSSPGGICCFQCRRIVAQTTKIERVFELNFSSPGI